MKEQIIRCDVCACRHHDKRGGCVLESITVVPTEVNPTAHFCRQYIEK